MRYIHKKSKTAIVKFEVRKSAQKLFGVTSMPDWPMLVGIGEDGKVYPICFADGNAEKDAKLIEQVVSSDYEVEQ